MKELEDLYELTKTEDEGTRIVIWASELDPILKKKPNGWKALETMSLLGRLIAKGEEITARYHVYLITQYFNNIDNGMKFKEARVAAEKSLELMLKGEK